MYKNVRKVRLDSVSRIIEPEGAYTNLETLIGLRFAAAELKLRFNSKALSLLTGPNKTNFRGRGIDFEEVRAYQPGDDIRTIDWRVTARTSKAHTKLFREERERPVLLFVDQRQSMFFGSQRRFKSVQAAATASLLGWAALNGQDRIGGLLFNDQTHKEFRPRRSRNTMLQLLRDIHDFNNQLTNKASTESTSSELNEDSLANAMQELRRISRPGSSLFLISDFSNWNKNVQKNLHQLARHNEITALFIYDPLETHLPPAGHYTVTNGITRYSLTTGDRKTRERFVQQFKQHQNSIKQELGLLGIPMIPIATNDSPVQTLNTTFSSKFKP